MTFPCPAYPLNLRDFYATDFSEYPTGVQPHDWTSHYGTGFTAIVQTAAGSLSGNVLRWTKTSASRHGLSWDRVPPAADVEILFRMRLIEAGVNADNYMAAFARGAGSLGSETGYRALTSEVPSFIDGSFAKYVGGTGTAIGSQAHLASKPAINTWWWQRSRFIGTSLQRRWWLDSSSEPATWNESITDGSVTAPGWTGLFEVTNNPNLEVDFFSVALGGATAPSPA